QSVSPNCTVSTRIFHTIPDGREFEFVEGSVCHHPGECELVIEYIITCFDGPGGGGGGTNPGPGEPGEGGPGGGGPGGGPPDNGGPSQPIPIMQPPLGQEGTTNTIEQLQSIIEEPLSIVPSGGEINIKTSALLAYLFETNAPVFEDLNTI